MIKRIAPFLLAPIPFLFVAIGLCIWIIVTPENLIDGRPDNAPDRAAVILLIFIPIILYPVMIAGVMVQSKIMKLIHQVNIKGCFSVGILSIIPLAIFCGIIMCEPQFGESVVKSIAYSIAFLSSVSCFTLLIYLGIRKVFQTG